MTDIQIYATVKRSTADNADPMTLGVVKGTSNDPALLTISISRSPNNTLSGTYSTPLSMFLPSTEFDDLMLATKSKKSAAIVVTYRPPSKTIVAFQRTVQDASLPKVVLDLSAPDLGRIPTPLPESGVTGNVLAPTGSAE